MHKRFINDGSASPTNMAARRKHTLLCVDDDETGLLVRKLVLEANGYTVLTASTPEEGLRLFNSCAVDAVVVDYLMPVMDGKTLSIELKVLRPRIPVIMLTAIPEVRSHVALVVDAFLEKGDDPEQLLSILESLLNTASDSHPQELESMAKTLDVRLLLTSVIDATNADFGTVQLLDRPVLRIVAHRGFGAEFLKHFATVSHSTNCCCGAAMNRGSRVLVNEVVGHPLFEDAETQAVMLNARVRAVQSTPFFDGHGSLVGVVATHFQKPTTFTSTGWMEVDHIIADFSQKLPAGMRQAFPSRRE